MCKYHFRKFNDPSKNQLPAISLEDVTASTIEGANKTGSNFIKNFNEKK
jgi:hypothetical protein